MFPKPIPADFEVGPIEHVSRANRKRSTRSHNPRCVEVASPFSVRLVGHPYKGRGTGVFESILRMARHSPVVASQAGSAVVRLAAERRVAGANAMRPTTAQKTSSRHLPRNSGNWLTFDFVRPTSAAAASERTSSRNNMCCWSSPSHNSDVLRVQNLEVSIHVSERDQPAANCLATSPEGLPWASSATLRP